MNDIAKNAAHEIETLSPKEFQGYSQTRADYAERVIASHIAPLHAEIAKLRAAIEHLMAERRRTIRVLGDNYDDSDDRPLDSLVSEAVGKLRAENADLRVQLEAGEPELGPVPLGELREVTVHVKREKRDDDD